MHRHQARKVEAESSWCEGRTESHRNPQFQPEFFCKYEKKEIDNGKEACVCSLSKRKTRYLIYGQDQEAREKLCERRGNEIIEKVLGNRDLI